MKIALFVTATGKYIEFLPKLFSTAEKYFMKGYEVTFVVFTDDTSIKFPEIKNKIIINKVDKVNFPYASMNRCMYYQEFCENIIFNPLKDIYFDYCYAIDADAYFDDYVADEIFGGFVSVMHCAFVNKRGTFEENNNSFCYVSKEYKGPYLGGGFYGGSAFNFFIINQTMNYFLQQDRVMGITPIWHDESALNAFFSTIDGVKILDPSYHYPGWDETDKPNPWVNSLWAQEKEYIKQTFGIDTSFKPKIIFIEKGNLNKGADYYRS